MTTIEKLNNMIAGFESAIEELGGENAPIHFHDKLYILKFIVYNYNKKGSSFYKNDDWIADQYIKFLEETVIGYVTIEVRSK